MHFLYYLCIGESFYPFAGTQYMLNIFYLFCFPPQFITDENLTVD